jgi:hypothetical protein
MRTFQLNAIIPLIPRSVHRASPKRSEEIPGNGLGEDGQTESKLS